MSVSFYTELGRTTGYAIQCFCGAVDTKLPVSSDYTQAVDELVKARGEDLPESCTCDMWALHLQVLTENPGPEVNVSNVHAAQLLKLMGFSPDAYLNGCLPAADFEARVQRAFEQVSKHPEPQLRYIQGVKLREFASLPDYHQHRLLRLREVARHALKVERAVCWG